MRWIYIGTLWLLASVLAVAQQGAGNQFEIYQGRPVTAIELAGRPGLDAAPILAGLAQQPGTPLEGNLVSQAMVQLRARLGSSVTGITVNVIPEVAGVRLQFLLEPAEYFGVFQFPGALQFSYTRLLEAAHASPQTPYTPDAVTQAVAGLRDFFRQHGYFQSEIAPSLQQFPSTGLVSVIFHVTLGSHARFGTVNFSGATPTQTVALHSVLNSWRARLLRKAVRTGQPFSLSRLQSATAYLQSHLSGEGYLGAQVTLEGASYHPLTNRADVTFTVVPSPKVTVAVTGAHLWPWTRHSLLPFSTENRVGALAIQDGQQNLTEYFASKGFFNATVSTSVATTSADGQVHAYQTEASAAHLTPPPPPPPAPATPPVHKSITYAIAKGPRHSVSSISFRGNHFFSRDDLLPLVAIQGGGFLSHGNFNAQLLQQSVSNLEALYQSSGYSSVTVTPLLSHPGGNLTVVFQIDEGLQDFVASLTIEGNTIPTAQLAPQGLMIGTGTPFAQTLVNQDRAQILAYYLSHGYLNATFRATAATVAHQPHLVNIIYHISEGPEVHTAKVVSLGAVQTQPRLLQLLTSDLKPGTPLTENDLLATSTRLYSLGIFDWAEVSPRRPITDQQQAEVVVKVHEAARNSLVYGFGFDLTNRGGSVPSGTVALPGLPVVGLPSNFQTSETTFFGPSVNAEYTRLNVGGKAGTLSFGGFAGRLDQHGSVTWTDPRLFWSNFTGNLVLSGEHNSQNPIFTSRVAQIGYQLERPLNSDQTTNLFLRYSFSQTDLSRLLIPDLVPERDRHLRLSTLSATFLRDTRDNPLDAHKGMLESYELDLNSTALGSSVDFAKLVTQTAYYRSLHGSGDNRIIWANSLRAGAERAFAGSFIPLSQAFFTGGGSTLRGFPLDGAGPQKTIPACGNPDDPSTCSLIQVPVGGSLLLILNSELRIPTPQIWNHLGIAVFYDGGNVFKNVGLGSLGAAYTNTLGFGLRYQTAVGPIRIDLGHNLNAPPGVKSTQLFITLGQAF